MKLHTHNVRKDASRHAKYVVKPHILNFLLYFYEILCGTCTDEIWVWVHNLFFGEMKFYIPLTKMSMDPKFARIKSIETNEVNILYRLQFYFSCF